MKKTKYKGVYWKKNAQKWLCKLRLEDGTYMQADGFETDREAAKDRDLKIIKFRINEPLQILKKK